MNDDLYPEDPGGGPEESALVAMWALIYLITFEVVFFCVHKSDQPQAALAMIIAGIGIVIMSAFSC